MSITLSFNYLLIKPISVLLKKEVVFLNRKSGPARSEYFQIFLVLQMTDAVSIIMSLKIIKTSFILIIWNSRRKLKSLAKTCFLIFQKKVHNRKFINGKQKLSNERDAFSLFISYITYLDNNKLAEIIYRSIGFQILRIVRTTSNLINMVPPVNLFDLIRMKKQGMNILVLFYYQIRSLGNTLQYFLSLQVMLTNLLNSSLLALLIYAHVYVCVHLYTNVCKCIFSVYFMFCRCVCCIFFRYIT